MTTPERTPDTRTSTISWRTRIIAGAVLVVVLIVAYLILAAFIPRWWAQRVGEMVNGSFSKGIGWGLVYGGLCTAIPLLLLLVAALVWRRRGGKVIAGGAVVLALVFAIPNLMTLTVVLGGNNAAHAGERIMDVDAPAFRGASLTGAIIAALIFLLVLFLVVRRGWRRRAEAKALVQSGGSAPIDTGRPVREPGTAPRAEGRRPDHL
ncbi:permease [Nocardia cyriacigeorgica]|uniref:permease n=1 Tax=Nocardia cyriacigeorgica TaxID=135487 RepID=UPI00189485C9|nr:permease [Nocardia cyriacigeorgica]MBF6455301.1 permease [Nocardia cyriacigeorgica]MBF6479579.1 permease [Nocardia cyriacigeorgica]MBF6553957.1 permease [Nocardia cyriacigeorgica]